jgi:hypothetical protein
LRVTTAWELDCGKKTSTLGMRKEDKGSLQIMVSEIFMNQSRYRGMKKVGEVSRSWCGRSKDYLAS